MKECRLQMTISYIENMDFNDFGPIIDFTEQNYFGPTIDFTEQNYIGPTIDSNVGLWGWTTVGRTFVRWANIRLLNNMTFDHPLSPTGDRCNVGPPRVCHLWNVLYDENVGNTHKRARRHAIDPIRDHTICLACMCWQEMPIITLKPDNTDCLCIRGILLHPYC